MAEDRLIWFKGALMPAHEARVPVLSPTAQFGLNVFEGIRGYWSVRDDELYLFRLDDHIKRLAQSCRLIGIACPHDVSEITAAIREVLRVNEYRCDIAVRVTVFVDGEGTWHSSEPVGMFVAPIARPRRDLADTGGQSAGVSTWERISDRVMPPRIKAGANYLNGRYAHLEARRNGHDVPVLLGPDGKVAEGAGSCLFLVRDGRLITPPVTGAILESITRDTLLRLASDVDLHAEVRPVDRTELYVADEVFLCGTAAELTPLTEIDGHTVGAGRMGPLTHRLLEAYLGAACDSADPQPAGWRTPVWQAGET